MHAAERSGALRDGRFLSVDEAWTGPHGGFVLLGAMDEDAAVELRPELCAPAVDPDRIAAVSAEIDRIACLVERGEPANDAVAAFNELTGHAYEPGDFLHYGESRDLADFAREAARPAVRRIADITRGELTELVRRIQLADNDSDYYLRLFEANVLHPRVSDLIYWPPQSLANGSPDDIVETALSYRPPAQ